MPPRKKKRKLRSNIIKWVISLAIAFFFRFPLILEQFKLEQNPKPEFFLAQAPMAEEKGAVKAAKPDTEIRSFSLTNEQINNLKQKLGITPSDKPAEILRKIYLGLYSGEKKAESGNLGISYIFNKGLTKSPLEVLISKKADCDELTRTAYILASKLGVTSMVMIEMTWAKGKTQEGHAALVLMPEKAGDKPLLFDFTYQYNAIPLDSTNIETEIKKKYEEKEMQNFKVERQLKTLQEAEASYYSRVGGFHLKKKKLMLAIEAYEKAVKLAPSEIRYNYNLAVAYRKLSKLDNALEALKNACDLIDLKTDRNLVNGIHEKLAFAYHDKGAEIYNKAQGILKQGKREEAKEMFNEALELFKEALTHLDDERIQKAIKTAERKLEKLEK